LTLLLFGHSKVSKIADHEDVPLSKLFFDAFSSRVSTIEQEVRGIAKELEKLRVSRDRSQISDLVLLERLEKAEEMLGESLGWIKKVANAIETPREKPVDVSEKSATHTERDYARETQTPVSLSSFVMPGGEAGSLSSITTPTELQVLSFLSEQGPKSAPEVGRVIGRSREHSARLMKKLFEEGYVRRDQARIPFRYSVVERVRASFKSPEKKESAQQEAAPAQT